MRQSAIIKYFRFLLWINSIQHNPDFGQIVTFNELLKLAIFHNMLFWLLKWPFCWIKVLFRRNGRTFVKRFPSIHTEQARYNVFQQGRVWIKISPSTWPATHYITLANVKTRSGPDRKTVYVIPRLTTIDAFYTGAKYYMNYGNVSFEIAHICHWNPSDRNWK